jgi:hypothetical protein
MNLYNKILSSLAESALDQSDNGVVVHHNAGQVSEINITPYDLALNIKEPNQFEALKAGFPYKLALEVHTPFPIHARNAGLSCDQAINIKGKYQFAFLETGCTYNQALEVHTAYPIYARNAGLSCEQSLKINSESMLDEFLEL